MRVSVGQVVVTGTKPGARFIAWPDSQKTALDDFRAAIAVEARAQALAELAADAVRFSSKSRDSRHEHWPETLDYAVLLAERLLGEALGLSPTRVTAVAKTLLAELDGVTRVRVEAHPEDLAILRGSLALDTAIDWIDAPSRPRGEPLVHTEGGIVEGNFGPRLEVLRRSLEQALSEER
jgi:flagellar biosynthesis/type III secretory pathway protein FliH